VEKDSQMTLIMKAILFNHGFHILA